jgi:demethylsterigmatocystin 6-O-methyltransferase
MDEVINQVTHLASTADEATRKKLIVTLRDLAYSIESPDDTMQRIMFLVSLSCACHHFNSGGGR